MRKRHPNDVIDSFQVAAQASLQEWSAVSRSVVDQPVSLRRGVSKDAFFRLAVRWEVFRSDWHIAAAARDATQLRSTIAAAVDKALSGRSDLVESRQYIDVAIPAHPTLEQTRRLLDPAGRNISLSASSSGRNLWIQKSEAHLVTPWVDKVRGLPLADHKVAEVIEHLRNVIAHESRSSLEALNAVLAAVTGAEQETFGAKPLRTGAAVSTYLHTSSAGSARVGHFHNRMAQIADRMRL